MSTQLPTWHAKDPSIVEFSLFLVSSICKKAHSQNCTVPDYLNFYVRCSMLLSIWWECVCEHQFNLKGLSQQFVSCLKIMVFLSARQISFGQILSQSPLEIVLSPCSGIFPSPCTFRTIFVQLLYFLYLSYVFPARKMLFPMTITIKGLQVWGLKK